jgi:hypothetical protein
MAAFDGVERRDGDQIFIRFRRGDISIVVRHHRHHDNGVNDITVRVGRRTVHRSTGDMWLRVNVRRHEPGRWIRHIERCSVR